MKNTRFVILALLVFSFILVSCGVPPTSKDGYEVVLLNGGTKFLDYPYCYTYSNTNIYASIKGLYVRCGRWTTNSTWDAILVTEYEAQILSFEVRNVR